jgi:hypothetical protein
MQIILLLYTFIIHTHKTQAFISSHDGLPRKPSNIKTKVTRLYESGDSTRDMTSLKEWAVQNRIEISSKATISLNSGDDYGIRLNQSAKGMEKILSVPKAMVLDSEKLRMEWNDEIEPALNHIEKAGFKDSGLNFILMLKVIKEYLLKEESKWSSWIASLPQSFTTGVCMDEVEMSCLPPFALALANFERQQLETFSEAIELLQNGNSSLLKEKVDPDLILWAFNIVTTRCWRYAQDLNDTDVIRPIIVPIGDLMNHHEPPNVFVRDSDANGNVDFVLAHDVTVEDDTVSNLYLSYGLTNPHRFLIVFGFVDTSMPEIFSQLIFNNPTPELINLGCNDRSKLVYRTSDGGISTTIWDCILFTLLAQVPHEQDLFYTAAALENNMEEKLNFHAKYALEESMTLRGHVKGTVQELKDLIDNIDSVAFPDAHPRLELIRRHNVFLYETFNKVLQRIEARCQTEVMRRRGLNV